MAAPPALDGGGDGGGGEPLLFSILLIGDAGVGKSSLLNRFVENTFAETPAALTLGVDYKSKEVDYEQTRIRLQIWDTAGQETYRALTSSYYRRAHGIFIVYDITRESSYNNIAQWLGETQRYAQHTAIKMILGNKSDLEGMRVVDDATASSYARKAGYEHVGLSARTGQRVDEAFMAMTAACHKHAQATRRSTRRPQPSHVLLTSGGAGGASSSSSSPTTTATTHTLQAPIHADDDVDSKSRCSSASGKCG